MLINLGYRVSGSDSPRVCDAARSDRRESVIGIQAITSPAQGRGDPSAVAKTSGGSAAVREDSVGPLARMLAGLCTKTGLRRSLTARPTPSLTASVLAKAASTDFLDRVGSTVVRMRA